MNRDGTEGARLSFRHVITSSTGCPRIVDHTPPRIAPVNRRVSAAKLTGRPKRHARPPVASSNVADLHPAAGPGSPPPPCQDFVPRLPDHPLPRRYRETDVQAAPSVARSLAQGADQLAYRTGLELP